MKTYTFQSQTIQVPDSFTEEQVREVFAHVSRDIWDAEFQPNDNGGSFVLKTGTKG